MLFIFSPYLLTFPRLMTNVHAVMVFTLLLALGTAEMFTVQKKDQCKVSIKASCPDALNVYNECYKPSKEVNAEMFCKAFERLVEKAKKRNQTEVSLPRIVGLKLNQVVDEKLDEFLQRLDDNLAENEATDVEAEPNPLQRHHNCQDILCFADDPLRQISNVPEKVNLIEKELVTKPKDQGECSAGWAFTAVSALENALLRDGSRHKIRKPFWSRESTFDRLDLSEQFFLSNTRGYNAYCETGDFSTALNYMQKFKETIETESNFPYDPDKYETRFHKLLNLKYKIDRKQRYRPFRVAPTKMKTWQKTPIVKLYYDPYQPMTLQDTEKIKQYLARGIQVAATIYVDENGPLVTAQGKEVLHQECPRYQKNHQVSIIGYDKMNVTNGNQTELQDVWIIKNSWGTSWGDKGLFYVPIGKNSFCIEHYALAILSKHYNISSMQVQAPETIQNVQKQRKNIVKTLDKLSDAIEQPSWTLENDSDLFGLYLIIAVVALMNLASISFCIVAGHKRRRGRRSQQESLVL